MTNLFRVKFQLDDTKNVSEVVRAALRLLENEESKVITLKNAIVEGLNSGIAHNFDAEKKLKSLKDKRKN